MSKVKLFSGQTESILLNHNVICLGTRPSSGINCYRTIEYIGVKAIWTSRGFTPLLVTSFTLWWPRTPCCNAGDSSAPSPFPFLLFDLSSFPHSNMMYYWASFTLKCLTPNEPQVPYLLFSGWYYRETLAETWGQVLSTYTSWENSPCPKE